jgi:hypothetical protein
MLKRGGTVLLASTQAHPLGLKEDQYPRRRGISGQPERLPRVGSGCFGPGAGFWGDPTGRIANVVMMGILSTLPPFDQLAAGTVAAGPCASQRPRGGLCWKSGSLQAGVKYAPACRPKAAEANS